MIEKKQLNLDELEEVVGGLKWDPIKLLDENALIDGEIKRVPGKKMKDPKPKRIPNW